jgi:hypothetical protein
MSTEAIAFANLGRALARKPTEEEREIQRGIDATIRAVAADRYNPVHQPASPTVTVQSGVQTKQANELLVRPKGWVEPVPLAVPPGQDAIERLANAALPHGRESRAGKAKDEA